MAPCRPGRRGIRRQDLGRDAARKTLLAPQPGGVDSARQRHHLLPPHLGTQVGFGKDKDFRKAVNLANRSSWYDTFYVDDEGDLIVSFYIPLAESLTEQDITKFLELESVNFQLIVVSSGLVSFVKSSLVTSSVPKPSARRENSSMLDVSTMTVSLKYVCLPARSVSTPASKTCRKSWCTAGCAFSNSSRSTTENGFCPTASNRRLPSSKPT